MAVELSQLLRIHVAGHTLLARHYCQGGGNWAATWFEWASVLSHTLAAWRLVPWPPPSQTRAGVARRGTPIRQCSSGASGPARATHRVLDDKCACGGAGRGSIGGGARRRNCGPGTCTHWGSERVASTLCGDGACK